MAFHCGFVTFVLVATIISGITSAKEFIVGDETGWTIGFNYQAWAEGKKFQVGDTLAFKYLAGAHNVFKVNGTEFQNCIVPAANKALTTGNDTIVLATPGRKWYICGVARHCAVGGQKLFITVEYPSIAPSPTFTLPYTSKGAKDNINSLSLGIIVAILAFVIF